MKTLCTLSIWLREPIAWKSLFWGIAFLISEGGIQAEKGEKYSIVLPHHKAYEL